MDVQELTIYLTKVNRNGEGGDFFILVLRGIIFVNLTYIWTMLSSKCKNYTH